jgi:hypothetical protein
MRAVNDLGYEAIFALGINDIAEPVYPVLGYEMLPDMPRWVRVFDVDGAVALLTDSDRRHSVSALRQWCAKFSAESASAARDGDDVSVVDWEADLGPEWDRFWTDHVAPFQVGPSKDSSYLTWRYIEHPTFDYQVRVARQASTGRLLGMTVFRVERIRDREERVLRILELLSSPEAETPLARSVVQAARDHQVVFADFYNTSTRLSGALGSMGLRLCVPDKEGPGFPSRFQPLEPGHFRIVGGFWLTERLRAKIGTPLDLEEFYITRSDGDQDRPN